LKKHINRKKVLIVLTILIILSVLAYLGLRYIKSNVENIAPNIQGNDGMVNYINNLNGVNIKDRKIEKLDGQQYIVIQIENTLDEDRYDIPIQIEFVNLDGDMIYNTGYIVKVLLRGMTNEIYALITPDISNMVKNDKIDHVIINEM